MLKGRRKEIFEAIWKYIGENGFSPTIREIGDTIGLKSSGTVHRYLDELQKDGYITKHASQPRTIRILKRINITKKIIDLI